jgi:hypothetical protein
VRGELALQRVAGERAAAGQTLIQHTRQRIDVGAGIGIARPKSLRRHVVPGVEEYLDAHNEDPKPFKWTATAESILAKVRRGRVGLQQVVSQ